jgi:hypothetical protein
MRNILAAASMLMLATALPAQQTSQAAAARADSAAQAAPERRQLERRLHERLAGVVRDRLHLSQDQVEKLEATNQRYAQQRRALAQRERALRLELRQQLRRADSADQKRVAELLDQALQAQQARLDLYRNEQSDLSAFLTPVQRAQYIGLQEQVRDRVDDLRRRSSERRGHARPGDRRPSTAEQPAPSSRDR